jgi:hypothetical protein
LNCRGQFDCHNLQSAETVMGGRALRSTALQLSLCRPHFDRESFLELSLRPSVESTYQILQTFRVLLRGPLLIQNINAKTIWKRGKYCIHRHRTDLCE